MMFQSKRRDTSASFFGWELENTPFSRTKGENEGDKCIFLEVMSIFCQDGCHSMSDFRKLWNTEIFRISSSLLTPSAENAWLYDSKDIGFQSTQLASAIHNKTPIFL